MPAGAFAQEQQNQQPLPDVEVIQEQPQQQQAAPQPKPKPKPKPVAASPKPKPKPQPVSAPDPVGPDEFAEPITEISEPAQIMANSPYGSTGGVGAAQRAQFGSVAPINARQTLPGDLQNYAGAGSRVTSQDLEEQRPLTGHEALARVPGVITVNDDGIGRHGGIGIRGTPYRRSRKVLVMEDGQPINFAPYLDSSSHYTPPIERIESIEVLRGYVVNYGPLTNHGIVNFRNLSPFGENETVLKFGVGYTEDVNKDWNNFRHVHTRQNLGHVGVVASYSGAETGGSWDNEVLRYNDFYGAIGFRDSEQDLTISGGYFRQRDRYDEDNFNGELSDFFANGRRKNLGAANGFFAAPFGYDESSYNGDHYRLQIAHNYYFDTDTTISTRGYVTDHERARFYPADGESLDELEMEGRDRRYRNYGVDSRLEFANRKFFGGMTQDIQVGFRYEENKFSNTNRISAFPGDLLDFGNRGDVEEQQKLNGKAFAAFLQSAIHVTKTFTVTPGIRFESYDVTFTPTFDEDDGPIDPRDFEISRSEHTHALPGVAFAWEAMPRSTIYGSYHRGFTPHIIRDAAEEDGAFPLQEEVGDNFQLGYRTTAMRGMSLDMAVFHSRIDNYQFGEAFTVDGGDRAFSSLGEVEISGFEIGARLESRPFHGGPWNLIGEAAYTYADAEITDGINDDGDSVNGNRVPESILNFANLTVGVQYKQLWDASVSFTYRGSFYTDADNTAVIGFDPDEGEIEPGKVDSQWLLSARTNYHVNDKLTLWANGQNLTDEFYITDVVDGIKPGIGRTVMGGFTIKFD